MSSGSNSLLEKFKLLNISISNVESDVSEVTFCFNVWAKPGAKQEKVKVDDAGVLLVSITSRPVEGAANKAIIKLLSKKLGISKSSIELFSGEKGRTKRFKVSYLFTEHKDVNYYMEKLEKLID